MQSALPQVGWWWISEVAYPRQIIEATAARVRFRYRSTTAFSKRGFVVVSMATEDWHRFVASSGAIEQWEDPRPKREEAVEETIGIEDILKDIPEQAAAWVRKHAAAFASLPAGAAAAVAAKLQRGESAEAEAAIYAALSYDQQGEWEKSRLDELKVVVDRELAASAAIAEGIRTATSLGATLLSSIGGALTMAITAGALRIADRIGEAGD